MRQHETIAFEDSVTRTLAAADRLRACGQAITPASLEAELKRTTVAATATDYAPPDPYSEPLRQLRASELRAAEGSGRGAITLPSDGSAPNPYSSVLTWGKR